MALSTLTIDLNVAIAEFENQLRQAAESSKRTANTIETSFRSVKTLLSTLGVGIGVTELLNSFKHTAEAIDQIGKASERTGIAVEQLSALRYAAELTDVAFEDLVSSLDKFNRASDTSKDAFTRLGISLKDQNGVVKSTEQLLLEVSGKFEAMRDGAGKTAIAMDLFGKSGAALIPFLNQGPAGIARLTEEAKRLGIVFSADLARAANEFNDNLKRIAFQSEAAKVTIVGELLPSIQSLLEQLIKGREVFGSFSAAFLNIGIGINPFENPTQNIRKFREELEALNSQIQQGGVKTFLGVPIGKQDVAALQSQIDVAEKKIKFLQFLQQQQALKGPSTLDARDLALLQTPIKVAAPEKPIDNSAVIKAQLDQIVAQEKLTATQRTAVLDAYHSQGLISEKEYYAARVDIATSQLRAELNAVRASITEQQRLLAQQQDPQKRVEDQAKIIALRTQEASLIRQIGFAPVEQGIKAAEAQDAYGDSVRQINIELLTQQHRLVDAAIAQQDLNSAIRERQKLVTERGADSQAVRDFEALQQQHILQAQINEREEESSRIKDLLAAKETNITAALQSSSQSLSVQLQAIDAIAQAREAVIPALRQQLALEQAIAIAKDDKQEQARIQARIANLNLLEASTSRVAVAAERMKVIQASISSEFQAEATAEQRIQALRQQGALNQIETLSRVDAARKASLGPLTDLVNKLQEVAVTDEQKQSVEQMRVAIESMAASANQVAEVFRTGFTQALTDPFADFITGAKSAEDALKSFGKNLENFLARLAAQNLAESFFGSPKSPGTGIVAGFAKLLSMEHGGIVSPRGLVPLNTYAYGGIATGPQLALFGEGRKNEAYVPLDDGRSIPVKIKGGSGTVINMTVVTSDADSFRRSQQQVTTSLARAARQALARA